MQFKMNDRIWEIQELTQEQMKERLKDNGEEPNEGRYYGLTFFNTQKIYIDKDLCSGQKRQTLMHELMHCYIGCYITTDNKEFCEEDVCNISGNSHNIIHKIVSDYFNKFNQTPID